MRSGHTVLRGVLRVERQNGKLRVTVGHALVGHLMEVHGGRDGVEWLWSVAHRCETGYAATRDGALGELVRRQGLFPVEEGGK